MSKVEKMKMCGWVFYLGDGYQNLDEKKVGKWMHFFNNVEFAEEVCSKAIASDVCVESKHSDAVEGVCCFYLNGDDIEAHKRVIRFFIENGLIRKTKAGKLYNISFKYDAQTDAGQYGENFVAEIKLDQFVDLATGKFIV